MIQALRICLSILIPVFGLVSSLYAQQIVSIEVKGNERLSKEAILQYVGSKVGSELSRTQVRDDLKTLYNTGLFNDVRIDVEQVNGNLGLVVIVEEKDYIQELEYRGNSDVSKEDLDKALSLKTPFLWDDQLVRQSIEKLRKLYRDKGYYLVTVRPEIVREGLRKKLVFEIDEGERVAVKKVYIQGNKVLSDQLLKDAMITKEGSFWRNFSRRGHFDEDLLIQIDTRRIQLEYLKRGYAFATIDSPSISFTPDRSHVLVTYSVVEGEQYFVGDIRFSGDLDYIEDPEDLKQKLKSQKSKVWNYLEIQEDVQLIQDIYGDQGYAYVNVNPVWAVNPENERQLDIEFRIDKGSIVYFGDIEIHGNYETLDRVIRRELRFSEGDLFNITNYRKSQRNLERLGYFSSIKFIQKDILAENRMDIIIEVEEKQTGSLTLGASFSSVDRFGIQGSFSKVNLLGRGYDINFSALFSSSRQVFSAYFRNPRVFDTHYSLTLQAFNTEVQSVDRTRIRERGGSISIGHPIAENWRVAGSYNLRDIDINIKNEIESYFPDSFGLGSSVGFSITRDTLNTREIFLPSSGSLNQLSTTIASKYLGSDLSYWQSGYTGKKYIQVFDNEVPFFGGSVLSFGLRLDYIRGIEGRTTPFNERFIPGGIYSIRGHMFRSLGPAVDTAFNSINTSDDLELAISDPDKLRLGGNKQIILNVEYLFDIFREAGIKGVLFFDTGNTFAESDYDFLNLRKSVGFGFRWFSPLGPLRFEWGIPLDRKEGEDAVLFDFSIGAPF